MKYRWTQLAALFVTSFTIVAFAGEIPADKFDESRIYYGNSASFEKPAGIDLPTILRSTPEYEEIQKKKIERGTGRYWILYSQASDRANKAIVELAHDSDYDLVASLEYLSSLEIECDDITELIVEHLEDE